MTTCDKFEKLNLLVCIEMRLQRAICDQLGDVSEVQQHNL